MANTILNQPTAVSLQLTDYALLWQGGQSPSTRKMAISNLAAYYLALTGGTVTGDITFSAAKPKITGNAGTVRAVQLLTGSTVRWQIDANATAESGTNAGSDLELWSYTDAGAQLTKVLAITRSSGAVALTGALSVSGTTTLSAALQMPNNVAVKMKDSGGTSRNVLFVDALDNTNIESAATGIRFLNQANSAALLTCLDSGVITTSQSITSGTGYGSRQGSGGGTSGNLFNIYWNGAGAFLYIDTANLGQFSFVSDRRVKHSIENNPSGALERIMSLRAVTYRFANVGIFKDDGRTRAGFIADEVAAVVPSAVDGEAGAIDDEGRPVSQTINPVPLIAELTAAVQQLTRRVTTLLARIETLEAKA